MEPAGKISHDLLFVGLVQQFMSGPWVQLHFDIENALLFELTHKFCDASTMTAHGIMIAANNQDRSCFGNLVDQGWVMD
jgi:hypothetical protein